MPLQLSLPHEIERCLHAIERCLNSLPEKKSVDHRVVLRSSDQNQHSMNPCLSSWISYKGWPSSELPTLEGTQ